MRRLLGVTIACLVVLLGLLEGRPSTAEFRVEETAFGISRVSVDDGYVTVRRSLDVPMYNATGGQLLFGTIVVPDFDSAACPLGDICVKKAPAGEPGKVIGVVTDGTSGAGAVQVAVAGVFAVGVTGEVSAGDFLQVSSTSPGDAEAVASAGVGVFAIALQSGETGMVGAIFIKQEVY